MARGQKSDEQRPSTSSATTPIAHRAYCWSLYIEGLSVGGNSGAGLFLIAPDNEEEIEKALTFKFSASNNQVEYEALVIGMELSIDMGIKNLVAYINSQLVVNQVSREYGANNPTLMQYYELMKNLIPQFEYWELKQTDHNDNT